MTDIDLKKAFYMEPKEVVKYFESKGLTTSFDWHEVYEDAHAKAFTVAKMTQADLLKDTHDMLTTAIKEGWSEGKFRKNATELFEKKGWTGFKEVYNEKTGETRTVELGTPRRIKKIFQCNMHSAYAVGRYKSQLERAEVAPYFQYVCILDGRTRPAHRAMNGKVFRYDDPIWNTMYPPNGWNCRCMVRQLSEGDIRRKGLKVETSEGHLTEVTENVGGEMKPNSVYTFSSGGNVYHLKPDAGWNTNLGKKYIDVLENQLQTKISQVKIAKLKQYIKIDIEAQHIYQNISKIKDIDILTAHYKKYDDIIDKRIKEYNAISAIYKKSPTNQNYKIARNSYDKLIKTIEKKDIVLGKYIDDVIASLNIKPSGSLHLGKISTDLKAEALTLKNDLQKLLSNIPANTINIKKVQIVKNKNQQKRSHYDNNGTIHLLKKSSNEIRLTALHEAMHWLEDVDKSIGQKSIEFLEKRTVNDKEEKLSVLTGNSAYMPWEVAKKDNFHSVYCGKIYKNSNGYYATEILSMGLQELLSNPIEFYKKDREYFKFVISVLKGDI